MAINSSHIYLAVPNKHSHFSTKRYFTWIIQIDNLILKQYTFLFSLYLINFMVLITNIEIEIEFQI